MERRQTTHVYLARYLGRSEFYSGVRHGAIVWLTEMVSVYDGTDTNQWGGPIPRRKAHVSLSVQGFWQDTAHLSVYDPAEVEVLA